jgi:hypothetical protein
MAEDTGLLLRAISSKVMNGNLFTLETHHFKELHASSHVSFPSPLERIVEWFVLEITIGERRLVFKETILLSLTNYWDITSKNFDGELQTM